LRAGSSAADATALRLDPRTLRVTAGSVPVNLGRVEFKLLHFLMDHPDRVYSRAQLLDQVWGHAAYLDERTVDAHVGRLRQALLPGGCGHRIETVRGSGYRFLALDTAVCA
jgi:two-component system phosphate regulon response regulator PhoB